MTQLTRTIEVNEDGWEVLAEILLLSSFGLEPDEMEVFNKENDNGITN